MKNYRLHFIRHGLTGANRQGAYAGRRTDVEQIGRASCRERVCTDV